MSGWPAFSRLKMGIDGAVHRVQDICYTKSILEDFGFLLVDAKIAFNYINIIGML